MGSIEGAIFGNRRMQSQLPAPRVLSSQAYIILIKPNFGVPTPGGSVVATDEEIVLGEIQSLEYEESFEPIKKFFPYGFKTMLTLTRPTGWSLTFNAEKVDWKMAYWVYANERTHLGNELNSFPTQNNTFQGKGMMGHKIMFAVDLITQHYDGTEERYRWKDVTILNFGGTVPDNNQPITERLVAYSPERLIGQPFDENHEISKMNSVVADILATMKLVNKA